MLLLRVCEAGRHLKKMDDYLCIMWNNLVESAESEGTYCPVRRALMEVHAWVTVPLWSLNSSCMARHSGWFHPAAPSRCGPQGRYLGEGMLQRILPVETTKRTLFLSMNCAYGNGIGTDWNFLTITFMFPRGWILMTLVIHRHCLCLVTHLSRILQGWLWHPMDQPLPLRVGVTSPVHILAGVTGHQAPYGWVV